MTKTEIEKEVDRLAEKVLKQLAEAMGGPTLVEGGVVRLLCEDEQCLIFGLFDETPNGYASEPSHRFTVEIHHEFDDDLGDVEEAFLELEDALELAELVDDLELGYEAF